MSTLRTILGTAGDDTLIGGSGAEVIKGLGGKDTIKGGGGNDWISGGAGADILDGGAGRDTFAYASISDSPGGPAGAQDHILNWSNIDLIDLSAIDANSLVAGNQAFKFAGYAFNDEYLWHGAGNIYIGGYGNSLWIIGYTNNDWTPDIMINLSAPAGEGSLTTANLIF